MIARLTCHSVYTFFESMDDPGPLGFHQACLRDGSGSSCEREGGKKKKAPGGGGVQNSNGSCNWMLLLIAAMLIILSQNKIILSGFLLTAW